MSHYVTNALPTKPFKLSNTLIGRARKLRHWHIIQTIYTLWILNKCSFKWLYYELDKVDQFITDPPMWHVTRDMWHMTCDTWHVTVGGSWTFLQNFTSLALTFWEWWFVEAIFTKDDWMNEIMNEWLNDIGVCKTASGVCRRVAFCQGEESPLGEPVVNKATLSSFLKKKKKIQHAQ